MDFEYYVASALPGMISGLFSSTFSIVAYVFMALGLYTIAKRRGLNNPWLAWVPLGNMWILGSIADQYQYSVNNRKTNRRKILLWCEIISAVFAVVLSILLIVMVAAMLIAEGSYRMEDAVYAGVLGMALVTLLLSLIVVVMTVIAVVFRFIACYDLYKSCQPENATLFLVLSIFFSILGSIFVFICRDKDAGMCPRPVQAPQQPCYQVYQPQEPAQPESPVAVDPEPAQEDSPAEEE